LEVKVEARRYELSTSGETGTDGKGDGGDDMVLMLRRHSDGVNERGERCTSVAFK
jgi:hypothetical protein